jgi:hypothetical protein
VILAVQEILVPGGSVAERLATAQAAGFDGLAELGAHAEQAGVVLLFEPLNRYAWVRDAYALLPRLVDPASLATRP